MLRDYHRPWLRADVFAGFAVAAYLVPQNAADPKRPVRWFVLNVEANVKIDITAADGLRDLRSDLAKQGVRLGLARVKTDLRIALERANLVELIGPEMMFPTLPVMEQGYLAWASEHPDPDGSRSAGTTTTVGPATSPAHGTGHQGHG